MIEKLRPWVVHIRGFDAFTYWAKSRSAAKYQAAKACCEAGYFREPDDECCPGCGACPGFTGIDCDETCEWATAGGLAS